MRKLVYIFVALSIISLLFQGGWAVYQTSQGKTVTAYHRLQTDEGINWKGIFSPLQVEAQSVTTDSISFYAKVMYPYGENFDAVAPNGNPELLVAQQIQDAIEAAKASITIHYGFDYDGSSQEVRDYQKPHLLPQNKRMGELELFGTASPESHKDGFEESVLPGNFEPENAELARGRAERTAKILDSLGYPVAKISSEELQFENVAAAEAAIDDPSILEDMRYVESAGTIYYDMVTVETMTMPWLLPLWILFSLWLLSMLRTMRTPHVSSPKLKGWDWHRFFRNILEILAVLLAGLLAWVLLVFLLILLLGILGVLLLGATMLIIFFFWKILRFLRDMLFIFWATITACFFFFWEYIVDYIRHIRRRWRECWKDRNISPCWKRVFITLCSIILLLIVVIICII